MQEINKMIETKQRVQFYCNYPNFAAMMLKEKYNLNSKIVGNSIILPLKEKNIANLAGTK